MVYINAFVDFTYDIGKCVSSVHSKGTYFLQSYWKKVYLINLTEWSIDMDLNSLW